MSEYAVQQWEGENLSGLKNMAFTGLEGMGNIASLIILAFSLSNANLEGGMKDIAADAAAQGAMDFGATNSMAQIFQGIGVVLEDLLKKGVNYVTGGLLDMLSGKMNPGEYLLGKYGKMIAQGMWDSVKSGIAGLFGGGDDAPEKGVNDSLAGSKKSLEQMQKDQITSLDDRKNLASMNGQKADDFVALRLESGTLVYYNKITGDMLNANGMIVGAETADAFGAGGNRPVQFDRNTQDILAMANSILPGSDKLLIAFLRFMSNAAQNEARLATFENRGLIALGAKTVSQLYGHEGSLEFAAMREYLQRNGENVYQSYLADGNDAATARALTVVFMAKMLNENARIFYGDAPGNTNNYYSTVKNPDESTYFYNRPFNSGNGGIPKLDCAAYVGLALYLAGIKTGVDGRAVPLAAGINEVDMPGSKSAVDNIIGHTELFAAVMGDVKVGDIAYDAGHIAIVSRVSDGQATMMLHSAFGNWNRFDSSGHVVADRIGVQESLWKPGYQLNYLRLR